MTYGANFIFRGTGGVSHHGWPLPSGSYCGNKSYYHSIAGGGSHSTVIDFRSDNSGCYGNYGGCYADYNMFSSGCCGGNGISESGAWTALGVGFGVGLLASPIGGAIFRGIGKGCSWLLNKAITPAAKWTWNSVLKPIGKGIGQAASWTWNKAIKPAAEWTYDKILKPVGQGIGNFFKGCWNWITGKGWNGTK